MKEAFSPKTELRKELDLYKTLLENSNLQEKIAEKVLVETKNQHGRIDHPHVALGHHEHPFAPAMRHQA